jgi:uncharacterized protein
MIEIGKYNTLRVLREVSFGFYLDGGNEGEILLPGRYAPADCKPGDEVEVFIYFDSEDRIIATTEKPFALVGEFAFLKVVSVNQVGAFLDWGLPKDLMVPFREQGTTMKEGQSYIVFIYIDTESNRIAASSKLSQFLETGPLPFADGDTVELLIIRHTELGYKAIINNSFEGILYRNEVFQQLKIGQRIGGFIKKVRVDGKIDLSLQADGYRKVDESAEKIFEILTKKGGFLPVNDKSPAEEIYTLFEMSKKTYKKAIGALYKAKRVIIAENGIYLPEAAT